MIVFGVTMTLIILFIPKYHHIYRQIKKTLRPEVSETPPELGPFSIYVASSLGGNVANRSTRLSTFDNSNSNKQTDSNQSYEEGMSL